MELKEIKLFEALQITDDRGGSNHLGYRYSKGSAELLAKGKGWYAGDGEVRERNYYTDGKELFSVICLGKLPVKNDKAEKDEILTSIRSKLSANELEALGMAGD